MCGIAGIYAYGASASLVDPQELDTIRDHMQKRGPDGKGSWVSNDRRTGLAHRRLAIIDLDERASQPMLSGNGDHVISFNGEIYNYRELRAELEAGGRTFRTESDTEVLLQLYDEYQHDMLPKLRGMYAFAIWDEGRDRLLMARDPYGIKPLYFSDHGGMLRFASQVKALLASGKISKEPDPAGLAGFLLFGSVPEPFTLAKDIRQLPAGHYCYADHAGVHEPVSFDSLSGIYSESPDFEETSALSCADAMREALLESVRYHLVADVPVGAFLSAGIDSGALVGLMRDAGVRDIQTITLGFEEFRGRHKDECVAMGRRARALADTRFSQAQSLRQWAAALGNINRNIEESV